LLMFFVCLMWFLFVFLRAFARHYISVPCVATCLALCCPSVPLGVFSSPLFSKTGQPLACC
jgi:hypothetical protein